MCASFSIAQSHPSWWGYASPNATALVGIDWQAVRASPFGDPVEAELWGDLGFPELPCLRNARHIVVSSPDLLALVSGNWPVAPLRDQAAKKGFKPMTYRGIDVWFASEKGVLSVARMSDQLLMIGEPKTLEMAIDRSINDSKNYSPLLARAAKFAQKDLWVVASQLPDDLANRFVPLDSEAQGFEGSVSVRNGLEIEATLTARSEQDASASADVLRKAAPGWPALVRALDVAVQEDSITLTLSASRDEVVAALRPPEPVATPPETIKVESPGQVDQVIVEKLVELPARKPVEPVVVKAPPEKPQVIRIVGLDEGPREIILPAVKQNP